MTHTMPSSSADLVLDPPRPVHTRTPAGITAGRQTAGSRSTKQPAPHHLLSRLQREWDRLGRSREVRRRVHDWALPVPTWGTLDELLAHSGYGPSGRGGSHGDEVLRALVLHARHDTLAARILLQRLLPGVSSLARKRSTFVGHLEATDELLAASWTVIRTYPIERRPDFVAASMLRAIEYEAFQRTRRRRAVHIPVPTATFDRSPAEQPRPTAADELAELLELARRSGLHDDDIELATRLGRGESTLQIAADRKVTDRTIRNHRAAVAHRLRSVALAAS
jgi:DNA-binding CsgD family transcriptional regulator